MKSLTLRLDEVEYEQLRTVARMESRPMSEVIREAIHGYIQRKTSHDEFLAALERTLQENARLIAELAGAQEPSALHSTQAGSRR